MRTPWQISPTRSKWYVLELRTLETPLICHSKHLYLLHSDDSALFAGVATIVQVSIVKRHHPCPLLGLRS